MAKPSKPLQPALIEHENYLEFRLQETASTESVKEQGRQLVAICLEKKPKRVLIDMTPATVQQKTIDRYDLGMIGSKLAPTVERVSVIAQAKLVDSEKFGVRVAQNRGLNVDIFTDRDAALAWLLA